MPQTNPLYRFFRPILWENEDPEHPYSPGGSAVVIQILEHLFLLTAAHCVRNTYWSIDNIRVPFRLQADAYFHIDKIALIRAAHPEILQTDECLENQRAELPG